MVEESELAVEWVLDAEGELNEAVDFYSPEADGLQYAVEAVVVVFDGHMVTWETEPNPLPPAEYVEVPVSTCSRPAGSR